VIRRPPTHPLRVQKATQGAGNDNIRNNPYQFTYRYTYRDGEVSVIAPWSELINRDDDDNPEGYNSIFIQIPVEEYIRNEVQRVEVISRDGNTGTSRVISVYDRDEVPAALDGHEPGNAISFYWHDDEAGIPISDAEVSRPFDSVPVSSKGLEVARNRLFLANNVSGYGDEGPISMTVNSEEVGGTSLAGDYRMILITEDGGSGVAYYIIVIKVDLGDPNDGYYYFDLRVTRDDFDNQGLPQSVPLSINDRIGDDTMNDTDLALAAIDAVPEQEGYELNLGDVGLGTTSVEDYAGPSVNVGGILRLRAQTFRYGQNTTL